MKPFTMVLLFGALVSFQASAQTAKPPDVAAATSEAARTSGPFLNGRAWLSWDDGMRLGFVIGIAELHMIANENLPIVWFKGKPANGEVMKGLQDFYQEPANARIAILEAISVVAMKFNGESSKNIDDATAILREQYAVK